MDDGAFRWWNSVVDPERDPNTTPQIENDQNMTYIWNEISPIIFSNLNPLYDGDLYWKNVRSTVKKYFKNQKVPSPLLNFPEFVKFLYKNRQYLHLDSEENIDRMIDSFADEKGLQNFFLQDFVYAVSSPEKVFRCYSYLHKTKNKKWLEFLSMHGSFERLIDLFISFVSQLTARTIPEGLYDYRLDIAVFMTDLFIEIDKDIVLKEDILNRFYNRLVKLIRYSRNESSLTYLRCAIALNNKFFPTLPADVKVTHIKALLAASPTTKFSHTIVLRYAQSIAGQDISYKKLIPALLKQGMNSITDFEVLFEVAYNSDDSESRLNVLRFFGRRMAMKKITMRISAYFLSILFTKCLNDEESLQWMQMFIYGLFAFIKLGWDKKKYIKRIYMLCEVLSSDLFIQNNQILKEFVDYGSSSCFSLDKEKYSFLSLFFDIKDTPSKLIEQLTGIIVQTAFNLKCVPFKPNSYNLIEMGKKLIPKSQRSSTKKSSRKYSFNASNDSIEYIDSTDNSSQDLPVKGDDSFASHSVGSSLSSSSLIMSIDSFTPPSPSALVSSFSPSQFSNSLILDMDQELPKSSKLIQTQSKRKKKKWDEENAADDDSEEGSENLTVFTNDTLSSTSSLHSFLDSSINHSNPNIKINGSDDEEDYSETDILEQLSIESRKYVFIDYELSLTDHNKCVDDLEDFIEKHETLNSKITEYNHFPKVQDFPRFAFVEITGIKSMMVDYAKQIYDYQKQQLSYVLKISKEIQAVIDSCPHMFVKIKSLEKHLRNGSSIYLQLRKRLNCLKTLTAQCANNAQSKMAPNHSLKTIIIEAERNFNPIIQYYSPSPVEDALEHYRIRHPLDNQIYEQCVENIQYKNVAAYISSIFECCQLITKILKIPYENHFSLLSQAFIRITFHDAYDSNSDLFKYKDLDTQFLNTIPFILNKPIKQMTLRPQIMKKISRFETLDSLMQYVTHTLSQLQWMCNPLDMSYEIYNVVQSLPMIFNTPNLTKDESIQIMLAVIAHDPPINPVSIAKFLQSFSQIITSYDMLLAIDIYKKAVHLVVNCLDSNDD